MWERFSYYGMRALLILYMVAPVDRGGLGFSTLHAGAIYGWYTSLVYAMSLPGGWLADRYIGQYRAVLFGGIVIALGHFTLALHPLGCFYAGLALLVLGTGLLKPNVSSMVGSLYAPGDPRRDAGFSLFYMGINVGAFLAPLVCGTLGQKVDWHLGFGVAGIGMTLGLVQFWVGRKRLVAALVRSRSARLEPRAPGAASLTAAEWKRLAAIGILFAFAALFFTCFEQAGSSLTLFADRMTRLSAFGHAFPSTWFQALNSILIIALAPVFGWLWLRLGKREPSSPAKFSLGLLLVGLGLVVLVPASRIAYEHGVRVSPLWLVAVYFIHTLGELCLSPVGLSTVTKLAPARFVGMMMGVWFLAAALGNKAAGWIGGQFDPAHLAGIFGMVGGITIAAALVLALLVKPVRGLTRGVR
jgi:POT family proton-dependent oligopeptide transporter